MFNKGKKLIILLLVLGTLGIKTEGISIMNEGGQEDHGWHASIERDFWC
tara:strand:+ start:649 stop:795 length:147 start_codon:yes stop_codon:yes gene_type:complete